MSSTEAAVTPRVWELFDVRVARTSRVSAHMVRVVFEGESLVGFADNGYDQRIKLVLPPQEGSLEAMPTGEDWYSQWRELAPERKPPIRTYTIRNVRAEQREIDVDLVDHGDLGPASAFARSAKPGDRAMIIGPHAAHENHGGLEFRTDLAGVTDQLIVGDDTAIPAIFGILERLPQQARGLVCIEVEHADARQPLDAPEGVRVEWLVRDGERGAAQLAAVRDWLTSHPIVGTSAEGATTVVGDGEDDSFYWEVTTERGEGVPPLAAWIAGESSVVKSLRRLLVREFEVPRSAVAFMGYWREGVSEN